MLAETLRYWRSIGFVVYLLLTVVSADAQEVTRGPYLQLLSSNSIVVRWRTSIATVSAVRYGTSLNDLSIFEQSSTAVTDHQVQLTNLQPNTIYYYAVGSPSTVATTGNVQTFFKTAPHDYSTQAIRAWILGDSGTANSDATAVRNGYQNYAAQRPADMILMLGDNAYNNGTDSEYQAAVFNMYPAQLRNTVLWATLGNHDGRSANSSAQSGPYYNIFTFPKNAEAGGVATGTEAYYSFDYGNIHFVCLNSHDVDRSTTGAMLRWLEADLQANDKEWLIAFWHHPPYSKGSHDSDNYSSNYQMFDMRENALPILEDYGVDLVLAGHSHSYERSYFLDGHYGTSDTLTSSMKIDGGNGKESGDGAYRKSSGGAPHAGAVHTVAGSSGKVTSAPLNHPAMMVSLAVLGSVILNVEGQTLRASFLDSSGNVRDNFSIIHGADIDPPRITGVQANIATSVEAAFSEGLDEISAENPSNYAIDNGISILSATLSSARTVTLSTTAHVVDKNYTLTVNGVKDIAGNRIATNSMLSYTYTDLAIFETRVKSGADDAEERLSTGAVVTGSSDLELIYDGAEQIVGMRFAGLNIPRDAEIRNAYIQFTVDELDSSASSLIFQSENADNALTFSETAGNISSRPRSQQSASWSPASWTPIGAAQAEQRSPNLSTIIQEITNRPGWLSGNAIVILVTGSGSAKRTAIAYDGISTSSPLLHVEYSITAPEPDLTAPAAPTGLRVIN
ncbi:MAG: metallophosphoesterase family protein [Deltaproteobacteria bacterium]|nr:metallophosphoesterase family protein [Deltaproteobacteria bacterium]